MEYKMNIETTEKTRDQTVSFTMPVQFLHVASNKFLACNYFEADIEKENFKLELNEFPSENTKFRFLPTFQH
jgi:inositol 1,4,5-triphosphate receptor type 1/inositol 1,4,5-triphosphate receptor type 3